MSEKLAKLFPETERPAYRRALLEILKNYGSIIKSRREFPASISIYKNLEVHGLVATKDYDGYFKGKPTTYTEATFTKEGLKVAEELLLEEDKKAKRGLR